MYTEIYVSCQETFSRILLNPSEFRTFIVRRYLLIEYGKSI